MAITVKDVDHVALLARLRFDEAEKQAFTEQLNAILGYMEMLNRLDTAGVEPTSHALPLKNVFRDDATRPGLTNEEALANAPAAQDGQFRVPRVV